MAEFKSFFPGVEVVGESVNAFLEGFPVESRKFAAEILEKHGIGDPKPGQHYPVQAFLDSMKEISDKFGPQMLYRIGFQIASNAKLPPDINTIANCLPAINVAYTMNHRGGPIGSYAVVEDQGGKYMNSTWVVCNNPYPCSFDWGVIEGFAQRFKPAGCVDIVVRHDESKPCRKSGADSCTFIVSWV